MQLERRQEQQPKPKQQEANGNHTKRTHTQPELNIPKLVFKKIVCSLAPLPQRCRTVPDSMLTLLGSQHDTSRCAGQPDSSAPLLCERLFMSIAGGLSWEDALTPLRGVSALAVIFMVIFIVITVFAVTQLQ